MWSRSKYHTCCAEFESEKWENIIDEPIELKSYDDISYRAKDFDNTKLSTMNDTIQPPTDSDELLRGANQSWQSVLNKADGTTKASPQTCAPVPLNPQVESIHPRAVHSNQIPWNSLISRRVVLNILQ